MSKETFEKALVMARANADSRHEGLTIAWVVRALEALAAERASARRSAALDALAVNDADEIARSWRAVDAMLAGSAAERPTIPTAINSPWDAVSVMAAGPLRIRPRHTRIATNAEIATARVAMARKAAPEPVTISHWGMH